MQRIALVAVANLMALGGVALADEPPAPPTSHFNVAFTGGALVPHGLFHDQANPGLDVGSRIGWTGKSGLGLVMNLEFAPLRREPDPSLDPTTQQQIDSNLFVGTLAPRFTIGHHTVQLWFAAGGGLLVERRSTETTTTVSDTTKTETDTAGAVSGSSGLELHLFSNGGLQFSGGYTRSLTDKQVYDFFSVDAGLVFVI